MFVIDCHSDTATSLTPEKLCSNDTHHLDFCRMKDSIGLQFFAFFLNIEKYGKSLPNNMREFIAAFHEALAMENAPKLLRSKADLACFGQGSLALMAIEGADAFIADPERELTTIKAVDEFYELGLRSLGLTWNNDNFAAGGCGLNSSGLTKEGFELVEYLEHKKIIIDLAHASRQTCLDVDKLAKRPYMVSHACAEGVKSFRARNLNDEQIGLVGNSGGIIGVTFVPDFLAEDSANMHDIAKHLLYFANKGGMDCLAFGSDFDGVDELPQGVSGAQSWERIIQVLNGYFSDEELEKICYKNALRFLNDNLE